MPVAENKQRVMVTFLKEDVEQMHALADSLNMTLSGLVSMCMHGVLQQDLNKAFSYVVDTLKDASIT